MVNSRQKVRAGVAQGGEKNLDPVEWPSQNNARHDILVYIVRLKIIRHGPYELSDEVIRQSCQPSNLKRAYLMSLEQWGRILVKNTAGSLCNMLFRSG